MSDPLTFVQKLERRWVQGFFVCVGLDPRWDNLPQSLRDQVQKDLGLGGEYEKLYPKHKWQVAAEAFYRFNCAIIDATHEYALAFKPQIACYEALGAAGYDALHRTIMYIRKVAPEVVVILDCKRQDIGSTNEAYVQANYEYLDVDAFTAHPYLGVNPEDAFLRDRTKTPIFMCRTSNDEAPELQDREVLLSDKEAAQFPKGVVEYRGAHKDVPVALLYQLVAMLARSDWNKRGNVALVVGATYPGEGAIVRRIAGDIPFLIPGIGAQGGDLEDAVRSCMDSRSWGMIINSSRGVIFACKDRSQPLEVFAAMAREEVLRLTREINAYRFKHMVLGGRRAALADTLMRVKNDQGESAVMLGSFRMKIHQDHPGAPESPHYFMLRTPDNKNGPLTTEVVELIADELIALAERSGHVFQLLAGLPKAGDPFAEAISRKTGKPQVQLIKESEGDRRWIDRVDATDDELLEMAGKSVGIFDDLVTGEDTKLEGAKVLREARMYARAIFVLIDRRPSGVRSQLGAEGLELHAVFTQAELINHYLATGKITVDQHARSHLYNKELEAFLQKV